MPAIDCLLLCRCAGSQSVDAASAGQAIGAADAKVCERLCTAEINVATEALSQDGITLIACGQQSEQFAQLAEELDGAERLLTVDIRDRAGWTDAAEAHAKQAALLQEALLAPHETASKSVESAGVCLVLGGEAALHAAARLAENLAVTCLLSQGVDTVTPNARFDVARGRVRQASGALGSFAVTVDGYAPADPAGRGGPTFAAPRDGAASSCDIILDLSGGTPLFPAHHKRNGYVRADPRDPVAVERAIFDAADLQGAFDKPLYVRFDAQICAHSRAGQTGCTRCLNVCPTGAISVAGDTVAIDTDVCAGCGTCAAVCPSGAVSSDDPPAEHLFQRLATLAKAYRRAGGEAPRVLFHDVEHGSEMIVLSARYGRGLPADVVPVALPHANKIGHAEVMAAAGVGFCEVSVLAGPATDLGPLEAQLQIARAILQGVGASDCQVRLITDADPDALEETLRERTDEAAAYRSQSAILPLGGRRAVTRLAAQSLAGGEAPPPFPLPDASPYGRIAIDPIACTLCLACVSLCPVGALADNADRPQVRFQESACVQCGICANACPESAITLEPRLNLANEALAHRVLHEEEPFECISCGKPFGVRSTVERIVAKLEGQHWMYANAANVDLIKMCDTCRVSAQYHSESSPLRAGERPRPRTTEDYISPKKLN